MSDDERDDTLAARIDAVLERRGETDVAKPTWIDLRQ